MVKDWTKITQLSLLTKSKNKQKKRIQIYTINKIFEKRQAHPSGADDVLINGYLSTADATYLVKSKCKQIYTESEIV